MIMDKYLSSWVAANMTDSTWLAEVARVNESCGPCAQAWVRYLDQFAAWKTEDAGNMEVELVRV
jgi:bacterioferritin-associated ferredoxin